MEALVITVDYDMYASAGVARESGMFLVDELGGFLNARADGHFAGFPDPTGTLGGFLLSRAPRPAGRVLVSHLGMSLTDLVFGDAIVTRAAALGLGTELPDTLSTEV
jgi:ornithine cyclodeaminase/alanine dehydrogenase-like protein (mu-crystallin family)